MSQPFENTRAAKMLRAAMADSRITNQEVAKRMGYTSHASVWGFANGKAQIPFDSAYKLGLSAGMTDERAVEFFIANLQERGPELYEVFIRCVNKKVAALTNK